MMQRGILIFTAAVASLAGACARHTGAFAIRNNTSDTILHAAVTVCGQTFEFENIDPGQSAFGFYRVRADSHYHLQVEFQSGTALTRDFGYVTNGLDFNDAIAVGESDIDIVRKQPT